MPPPAQMGREIYAENQRRIKSRTRVWPVNPAKRPPRRPICGSLRSAPTFAPRQRQLSFLRCGRQLQFDLNAVAAPGTFNCCGNFVRLFRNPGPRCGHQNDDSNFPILQVLLVARGLVRGFLVRHLSLFTRHSSLRRRRLNLHPAKAGSRLCAANSSTASTCSRFTPGNHCRKSSTVAPSSKFSKRAFTGTRVPRKTKAPLTVSGEAFTSEQSDQSNMVI